MKNKLNIFPKKLGNNKILNKNKNFILKIMQFIGIRISSFSLFECAFLKRGKERVLE
jgi:hypothetical protein